MLQPSTIQLLRFHFSLFLLPVFLFALSQLPAINWKDAALIFFILHVLVYPSSNGYNSYMDRDTGAIGGIAHPLQPTKQLFIITVIMDILAVILSCLISVRFAVAVILYILASRAYSYRGIRLKRFAIAGYILVIVLQGAVTFWMVYHGCSINKTMVAPWPGMLASSCLIGSYYPLTQIYQHEADAADGVTTISMKLGKRGSFIFCSILFAAATACMAYLFLQQQQLQLLYIFFGMMAPVLFFFLWWMIKVWQNEAAANFKNSLMMNVVAAVCTSFYFGTLLILKIF